MIYCIIVKREIEENYVFHHKFDDEPTRDDVLKLVLNEDLNYDDDYGKIDYFPVG